MKNVSDPENSVFRSKGFFIALYSCLGVVAILAAVVTFANREQQYEPDPSVYVGADQVDSYLPQAQDEAWFRPRQTPPVETPPELPRPAPPPTPIAEPEPEPTPEPTPEPEPPPPAPTTPPTVETFEPFTSADSMVWPVHGEIVMPFSASALIFDPTMDRFSTNDNIRIAGTEGDAVRAAADGRVTSIGTDFWRGNYVTIDHGGGWTSTIGQLMENVLVREGEIVRAGQVVGGIGQPSGAASLNGSHVHFHVKYNNLPVDPHELLQ
ncbi:MAG: M23 family metallopeptidase [Defluviitaleaceae bacterium]|nr:M23 family metallopeptidase [Defluviitaleaceae bacterium]